MSDDTTTGRKGMEKLAKWRKADTRCYEEFVKHLRSEGTRGYFYSFHKFVSGHYRDSKKNKNSFVFPSWVFMEQRHSSKNKTLRDQKLLGS